jgi:hypothetical protein
MGAIKRGLQFLTRHPAAGLISLLAYVLGVLSVLPFGVTVTAEVATVIAAITGSLAAVFGALWVSEKSADAEERRLSSYVIACIMGVSSRLILLEGAYTGFGAKRHLSGEDWVAIGRAANAVLEEIESARTKLAPLAAALYRLSVVRIFACDSVQLQLKTAENMARRLLDVSGSAPTRFYGAAFDAELANLITLPRVGLERALHTLETGIRLDEVDARLGLGARP